MLRLAIEIPVRLHRCGRNGNVTAARHLVAVRVIGLPFTLNISRARTELGYQLIVRWQSGIAAMQAR
jgi:hypothetical protein